MKKYKLVIFDVDGTIYDSIQSITETFRYTIKTMTGHDIDENASLLDTIGPPLKHSMERYGVPRERVDEAVMTYRTFYTSVLHKTVFYPGFPQILADLKNAGIQLAVASSKATTVVLDMFRNDNISDYFTFVAGLDSEEFVETKGEAIARALEACGYNADNLSDVVMVGDRDYDAIGAQQNNIDFVAAGYGPGLEEEFEPYPMKYYAKDVQDLKQYLLG